MTALRIGVLGTSSKENELRLPLHPAHIDRIPDGVRQQLVLEAGYGRRFGYPDSRLEPLVRAMAPRDAVIATTDVLLLPKPTLTDIEAMQPGQTLWGWPHAVQDSALTQLAIDKQLTLIAWEAMNHWSPDGTFVVHVFHLNNELAGYSSVLHALSLQGRTGHYGRALRAAVIGFGNTARGAITALQALGVHDITVLTMRDVTAVASPIPAVALDHLDRRPDDPTRTQVLVDGPPVPAAEFLARHDVIVNCVLQDTDAPLIFVDDDEIQAFDPGSLIVDVSCDHAMGFSFAQPTSFEAPVIEVGEGVTYYAVDHSPSYLWNSATWGISEALIPYLPVVASGREAWEHDRTIRLAIEIDRGVVVNPKILSFQRRASDHPHHVL